MDIVRSNTNGTRRNLNFVFGKEGRSIPHSKMGKFDQFGSGETVSIPTKDLLTWIFDNQRYDQNEPVMLHETLASITSNADGCRYITTLPMSLVQSLLTKPGASSASWWLDFGRLVSLRATVSASIRSTMFVSGSLPHSCLYRRSTCWLITRGRYTTPRSSWASLAQEASSRARTLLTLRTS